MKKLDGKVSVITGASTGIGKAVAEAFCSEGGKIVLAARNRDKLETVAEELRSRGATALAVPTDISREAQVVALFEKAMLQYGQVDILVNNAGIYEEAEFEETSLDLWQKTIDINLTGAFLCTREALKIMKRQNSGRIVNIGSIAAQMPRPRGVAYNCSKMGVVALTKTAALVGRRFGVTASCIHPGNVTTSPGMTDPSEPSMPIEDLIKVILAMATLSPQANMLETIVLPPAQLYLGRG